MGLRADGSVACWGGDGDGHRHPGRRTSSGCPRPLGCTLLPPACPIDRGCRRAGPGGWMGAPRKLFTGPSGGPISGSPAALHQNLGAPSPERYRILFGVMMAITTGTRLTPQKAFQGLWPKPGLPKEAGCLWSTIAVGVLSSVRCIRRLHPRRRRFSTAETYVFGDGLQPLLFVTLFGVALLCAGIMCMRKQRQGSSALLVAARACVGST